VRGVNAILKRLAEIAAEPPPAAAPPPPELVKRPAAKAR
jgi:hypothetical protein